MIHTVMSDMLDMYTYAVDVEMWQNTHTQKEKRKENYAVLTMFVTANTDESHAINSLYWYWCMPHMMYACMHMI